MEDSDSSWGSDEWEGYSDESDCEMVHSFCIEPNSPLPKGPSNVDNRSSTRNRSLVTSYGMDRREEEKPQVGIDLPFNSIQIHIYFHTFMYFCKSNRIYLGVFGLVLVSIKTQSQENNI